MHIHHADSNNSLVTASYFRDHAIPIQSLNIEITIGPIKTPSWELAQVLKAEDEDEKEVNLLYLLCTDWMHSEVSFCLVHLAYYS